MKSESRSSGVILTAIMGCVTLGCGGAVGSTSDGDTGTMSDGRDEAIPVAGDGAEGREVRDAAKLPPSTCDDSITLMARAEYPQYEYGRNNDVFSLSPDGARLLLFQGQYDPGTREFDLLTGESQSIERVIFERSTQWDFELAQMAYGGASLLDLERPESDVLCERNVLSRFDASGSVIIDGRCEAGTVIVRHTDVGAPDSPRETDTSVACDSDGAIVPVVPIAGQDVLFSVDGELFALGADVTSALGVTHANVFMVGEPRVSRPVSASLDGHAFSVALREDVATDQGTVTMLRYPSLGAIAADIPVRWMQGYANTYTSGFSALPMAWSDDGRFLALPSESGGLSVRSACDGGVVAELPPIATGDGHMAPTNLAFSNDGSRLVAKWLVDGHVYTTAGGDGTLVVYDVVRD